MCKQGNNRSNNNYGKGKGNQKKKGSNNGNTSSTSKARKIYTIVDVIFDIGDVKHAANVDTHLKVFVAYIRQSNVYGDYRQKMADALVDEVPDTDLITEPHYSDAAYRNSIDQELQPSEWAGVQDLLKMKYCQDRQEYQKRKKAHEDNTVSAASALFQKCTPRLQQRIENGEDMAKLNADAIKMKKAIKSYATSFAPKAHPLLHVIDAVRALFNIKQADDVDVEAYGKKLTSAKKILVERMGCKIIPIKYMEQMDGYDASNGNKVKECQDKAWDELVAMIGVLGVNDIKYKSMKEELKVDYSKGHCNYPKTIPSLKQQLDGRQWDANPNTTNRGNGKSTGLSKEAKEARAALIEAGSVPQSNFYQKSNKEGRCHCCGSKNHLLPKCPRKDDTAPNKWYQVTGVSLFQEVTTTQEGGDASAITATQASQASGSRSGRSSQARGGQKI